MEYSDQLVYHIKEINTMSKRELLKRLNEQNHNEDENLADIELEIELLGDF